LPGLERARGDGPDRVGRGRGRKGSRVPAKRKRSERGPRENGYRQQISTCRRGAVRRRAWQRQRSWGVPRGSAARGAAPAATARVALPPSRRSSFSLSRGNGGIPDNLKEERSIGQSQTRGDGSLGWLEPLYQLPLAAPASVSKSTSAVPNDFPLASWWTSTFARRPT